MANEKVGTDADVLHKMLKKLMQTLYPDASDKPGKRVIIKLDGGPVRLNEHMLADLRLLEFFYFQAYKIQQMLHRRRIKTTASSSRSYEALCCNYSQKILQNSVHYKKKKGNKLVYNV